MRIRNQKDFAAGTTFLAIGAGFAIAAQNYQMGTAARMGPGYFPFGLSIILMLFGAAAAIKSLAPSAEEERLTGWNLKGLFFILGGVVLFAFLLTTAGLVISVLAAVMLSRAADKAFHLKGSLGTAAVVIAICVFGFVYGLGLQMHIWPTLP